MINGNTLAASTLIDKGARINTVDHNGVTALHGAVATNQAHMVKLLISKKARINISDHKGRTPLDWAIREKHQDIATILQNHGAEKGQLINDEAVK